MFPVTRDSVIRSFTLNAETWQKLAPIGGEATENNRRGLLITEDFPTIMRRDLAVLFPHCLIKADHYNLCKKEHRVCSVRYSCTRTSCPLIIRVVGYKDDGGAITFYVTRVGQISVSDSAICSQSTAIGDSVVEAGVQRNASVVEVGRGNAGASGTSLHHWQATQEPELSTDRCAQQAYFTLAYVLKSNRQVRAFQAVPCSIICFSDGNLKDLRQVYLVLDIEDLGRDAVGFPGWGKLSWHKVSASHSTESHPASTLCEFLADRSCAESIQFALRTFHDGAAKYIGLHVGSPLAQRIQVRFVPAMISAVIRVFFNGMTDREYLNMCWKELAGSVPPSTVNIHICQEHANHVFECVVKKFYSPNATAIKMMMFLAERITACRKMEDVDFYVRKLLLVSASKKVTRDVDNALAYFEKQAPAGAPSFDFNVRREMAGAGADESLNVTTYFGSYFYARTVQIRAFGRSGTLPSSLHNDHFADMCLEILPYVPVLTGIMIPVREFPNAPRSSRKTQLTCSHPLGKQSSSGIRDYEVKKLRPSVVLDCNGHSDRNYQTEQANTSLYRSKVVVPQSLPLRSEARVRSSKTGSTLGVPEAMEKYGAQY